LRMTLMTLILTLIALTWTGMARVLIREWNDYSVALETVRVNGQVKKILQAGQNLAFERGRTNVLLNAESPADPKNLAFVETRRKAVDEYLRGSLFLPEILKHPAARSVQVDYMTLQQMRMEVDRALSVPKAARPTILSERWFI